MYDDMREQTYDNLFKRLGHICSYAKSKSAFVEPATLAYLLEIVSEIVRRHGTGVLQDVPPVTYDDEDIPI